MTSLSDNNSCKTNRTTAQQYNMAIMQNCLALKMLGSDILCKIFEYDNSHKIAYKNCVIGGVWSSAWRYWRNTSEECENPHVGVAMDYLLFLAWGVNRCENFEYDSTKDPTIKFFVNQYFPTNISIVERELVEDKVFYVEVYSNHHSVFRCTVVDSKYLEDEYNSCEYDRESKFNDYVLLYTDKEKNMKVLRDISNQ
jgi:hypothetical protein